jgi:hypothetical protein
MKELTIVRENLMNEEGYSPYCGNPISRNESGGCSNPRTKFNGEQFVCSKCGWISQFDSDFILRYRSTWGKISSSLNILSQKI